MLKIAFIQMSFLHFFAVFYKKYSDLLQVVFQCKKYSEKLLGNGTHGKTVIFTADIFAVQLNNETNLWWGHLDVHEDILDDKGIKIYFLAPTYSTF